MKYQILFEYDWDLLANKVNEVLSEGWQLQGGVSISVSETDERKYLFAQAIVRQVSQSPVKTMIDGIELR